MSTIETRVIINIDDGVDPTLIIEQIKSLLSSSNGKETSVNVVEMDDPITSNPINLSKETF